MAAQFTKRQGEYLAFLHLYTILNRRPPAEADIQAYFGISAAAVHQMIVGLENSGLIERTPGQARSIRLLIHDDGLPRLESGVPQNVEDNSFTMRHPFLAFWIRTQGYIEMGYDPNTNTWARALDEGGIIWSGGSQSETPEGWLRSLEAGVRAFMQKEGIQKN